MKINLQENFPIGAQPRLIYETIKADSVNDGNKHIRRSPHRQGATPANTFEADDKNVRHRHIRQSPHRQGGPTGKVKNARYRR